jgi:hypothetical protein
MVHAKVSAIGAQRFGRHGELDRLPQRVAGASYLRARRIRPVAEREKSNLLGTHGPILPAEYGNSPERPSI